MAGIYIHIPFCKTKCIYCDFYSTTRTELRRDYIRALCLELQQRADYLKDEPVKTVYFGGGTPSQLNEEDFRQVFQTLEKNFNMKDCTEITVEANPDDLSQTYTTMLTRLPFNRISMGIQTFHDETLKKLKRRHNAQQAIEAIENCRKAGFKNISIDLIYGIPEETQDRWQQDLKQAIQLGVEHISAYHLIYEEGTPLYKMLHQGDVKEVDEETSVLFFSMLMKELKNAGYEHYEISNFSKPGYRSKHNSSYWKDEIYLGCGPSAHSYNRLSREWNEPSLTDYIKGMENGKRPYETEWLDATTRYNERIITAMRTCEGMNIELLKQDFGNEAWEYCLKMAEPHLKNKKLEITLQGQLRLTHEGIFLSDGIMSDLLRTDE